MHGSSPQKESTCLQIEKKRKETGKQDDELRLLIRISREEDSGGYWRSIIKRRSNFLSLYRLICSHNQESPSFPSITDLSFCSSLFSSCSLISSSVSLRCAATTPESSSSSPTIVRCSESCLYVVTMPTSSVYLTSPTGVRSGSEIPSLSDSWMESTERFPDFKGDDSLPVSSRVLLPLYDRGGEKEGEVVPVEVAGERLGV